MPSTHGRGVGVLPRRRRRDEEGEDESSTAGDLDDFSISEGSAISHVDEDADIEGSDVSEEDEETRMSPSGTKPSDAVTTPRAGVDVDSRRDTGVIGPKQDDSRATINGVQQGESASSDNLQRDQIEKLETQAIDRASSSAPQLSHAQEAPVERPRREHSENLRKKSSNPAFVPNRGGFFLHDDRSTAQASPYGRPHPRGRGRGLNVGHGIGRGYNQVGPGPTEQQWAHDLHDSVNKVANSTPPPPPPVRDAPTSFHIPTAKPAAVAPNRTFSVSTVLGNVTVQVFLPGMTNKKTFQNLVKKQHTLLPQHRPPLRRDKPVRISIPNEDPRYIFPSTERSFIFIPRAMRPNQQAYTRGRGRGSFHGSRRPSIIGSAYTPSVAMSRRSSLGGAGPNGMLTPTGRTMPQGPMMQNFNRPVVRMPMAPLSMTGMPQGPISLIPSFNASPYGEQSSQTPTFLQSPTVALPMYQPRPQKTVSVAEIESPAVKAPQQQQEQPFHQQIPPGVSLTDGPTAQQSQPQSNMSVNTPLSHIPEGAVYAQPFQPYPVYTQDAYYGPVFSGGPMVYHQPADHYPMGLGGPVLPSQFVPGQSFMPLIQHSDRSAQPGAMAHESNGMVYYYDQSQFAADGSHVASYPMAVGGNGMMGVPTTGPYFYPNMPGGMFYPAT